MCALDLLSNQSNSDACWLARSVFATHRGWWWWRRWWCEETYCGVAAVKDSRRMEGNRWTTETVHWQVTPKAWSIQKKTQSNPPPLRAQFNSAGSVNCASSAALARACCSAENTTFPSPTAPLRVIEPDFITLPWKSWFRGRQ